MFITRADRPLTVHNEDGYDASHIYPSRVGEVTEVVVLEAEKEDEVDVYDIIDSTIPDDLDFNDCRIPGEKATIIFQSGVLTGREFDIEQTKDELTGYVHAERRFRLVPLEEYGSTYPMRTPSLLLATSTRYSIYRFRRHMCATISVERGRAGICSAKRCGTCMRMRTSASPLAAT